MTVSGAALIRLDERQQASKPCKHTGATRAVIPKTQGCEECLKIGATWLHLRVCMTCGQVSCCDSSQHRHARKHFSDTGHPIVKSLERGESWAWCYEDKIYV
jgi:K+:H+ antiporter